MENNNEVINSQLDVKLQSFLPRLSIVLQNKLLYSIQLLQKAEKLALSYDATWGYFLAFSGGKDSQCLYHVAKLAGVKFVAHMNLTSVDPPEVIRFVKQQYPDVQLIKPKKSIYQYAVEKQILPTQRVRWCCNEYKEHAGAGKVTLIGIRHAESSRRAKRNEVEISNQNFSGTLEGLDEYRKKRNSKKRKPKNSKSVSIVTASGERTLGCLYGKETLLISPIIHWTFADVWEFLNKLGVAHCELYDQGYTRIGCICCPMSSVKQKRKELARYPHVKRNWIKAIKAIRNGGGSKKNISGGTSARTGCLSKTSEHCSGRRRLYKSSRSGTLGGGKIIGSPNPRYIIAKSWLQTPTQFLPKRILGEQKRWIEEYGNLPNTGFLSSFSSEKLDRGARK